MRYRIYDYLTEPKPLRRVARSVRADELGTEALEVFQNNLVDTMRDHNGLGLAATQVNATAPDGTVWALFAMRNESDRWAVIANPVIVSRSANEWANEGCLSFRSVPVLTCLPTRVEFTCMGLQGETVNLTATGLEARIIAHETEHLSGKVLIDRLRPSERQKFLAKVARIRRP